MELKPRVSYLLFLQPPSNLLLLTLTWGSCPHSSAPEGGLKSTEGPELRRFTSVPDTPSINSLPAGFCAIIIMC